jgi:hypothetical protein
VWANLILRKGEQMNPGKNTIGFLVVCLALLASPCLAADGGTPDDAAQGKHIEAVIGPSAVTVDSNIAEKNGGPAGSAYQESTTATALFPPSFGELPRFLTNDAGKCTSGGPGATSCTYGSSCSVSSGDCKGGEHPCCSADFCGCAGSEMLD